MGVWIAASTAAGVGAAIAGGYVGVVTGALAIDLGVGRRTRALRPQTVRVDTPREEVSTSSPPGTSLASPRPLRQDSRDRTRHRHGAGFPRTPVRGRLVATTVETVRFTRPERVDFRLVRGPVPHVVERFTLTATETGTTLNYEGELGCDLWRLGQLWGDLVAERWERAVATSLEVIKAEAERRASVGPRLEDVRSVARQAGRKCTD